MAHITAHKVVHLATTPGTMPPHSAVSFAHHVTHHCSVRIWETIDGKETPLDFNLLCNGVWKLYMLLFILMMIASLKIVWMCTGKACV